MYGLVLPRDLFNQGKILQQIGKLCLAIHNYELPTLEFELEGDNFDIGLSDSGNLYIGNLIFSMSENPIEFYTRYNSRESNPLLTINPVTKEEIYVFTDNGEFTEDFLEMMRPD